jgi:hypothetical protein
MEKRNRRKSNFSHSSKSPSVKRGINEKRQKKKFFN